MDIALFAEFSTTRSSEAVLVVYNLGTFIAYETT
jgi:hypothetical protein